MYGSGQARDQAADAAAAWQAGVHSSRGAMAGVVSGRAKPAGYVDPQVHQQFAFPGAGLAMSDPGAQGTHDSDDGADTGWNNGGPGDEQVL